MNISKTFFLATKEEWNKLDSDIRISECLNVFRNEVINFIRPKASSFFNYLEPKGHIQDHKFKNYFPRRSQCYMNLWY